MRLLQARDDGAFRLVEVIGSNVPPYAILSHTWSQTKSEITYDVFITGRYLEPDFRDSYEKLRGCGARARRDGLMHFWVDTCCINKTSSAELSEAINSMFTWYRHADICYAYLSDVSDTSKFCRSRWFERGWTLQELIAPADVHFFDSNWKSIGFKTSLTSEISEHTGIRESALLDGKSLDEYSIAERMSWAANRHTTRDEDEAYCLLGIFGISMPLIYGEGRQAFFRLQDELLKLSDDASIFAFFSNRPSAPAGPSSLRIVVQSSGIQIHESVGAEVFGDTDEDSRLGTIGLFASSPIHFHLAARYAPYPFIGQMVKHHYLPAQSRLQVRRKGHLLKLEAILWKLPVDELIATWDVSDLAVQSAISQNHGIELSFLTVQKLRKCAQADMADWIVAFLDCHKIDGGIVGILLRETKRPGVYIRQHFPSLVETKHTKVFQNIAKVRICTVNVEADSLRLTSTYYTKRNFLRPPSFFPETERGTILRTINFDAIRLDIGSNTRLENGLLEEVCYYSPLPDIPLIALAPQSEHRGRFSHSKHGSSDGITCSLFPNAERRSRIQELASVFLPTWKGGVAHLELNNRYQLVLSTHVQWQRNKSWYSVEDLEKRSVLTMSVVELASTTSKSSTETRTWFEQYFA